MYDLQIILFKLSLTDDKLLYRAWIACIFKCDKLRSPT